MKYLVLLMLLGCTTVSWDPCPPYDENHKEISQKCIDKIRRQQMIEELRRNRR